MVSEEGVALRMRREERTLRLRAWRACATGFAVHEWSHGAQ